MDGSTRMVVDSDIRLDESDNPPFVEFIECVDPPPGGQGDLVIHAGIGGKNHLSPVVAFRDSRQLFHKLRAGAVILNDHPSMFEVVDLELLGDRLVINPPSGRASDVRA